MKDLVIFGNSQLAELAHFYFSKDSAYRIAAFTVDGEYLKESTFNGLPVVPYETIGSRYPNSRYDMFVAIGYKRLNAVRKEKYLQVANAGYHMTSYISSKSSVWEGASIGQNCMIMEGNILMPYCSVGNNVLVWVGSILSHHSKIMDHACITSHCAIGGNVTVGEQAFLGLNCTIRDGLTVGKMAVIGAGANLTVNANEGGIYLGNPAKKSTGKIADLFP
jgi:sugar O-acyltransferase (sialic acid O-acetyltransferase NeuD family)